MSPAPPFTLTLWTDDPALAATADAAGVDRIGVDLERLGKRERQRDPTAWLSPHTEADLARVAAVVRRAALFARLDPRHDGTAAQVERVLALGARVLMLPMVRAADEVAALQAMVGGRARVVPLLETPRGLAALAALPALGVHEAYVGINDLALSAGAPNRFVVLAGEELTAAARLARRVGVRLGIGGLARAGDDDLPVPSRLIYAQHARLGSAGALLSRAFFTGLGARADVAAEVGRARAEMESWRAAAPRALEEARRGLADRATALDTACRLAR